MPVGIVKQVKNKGKLALVTMERQDMCGECHACEMISGKKKCELTCLNTVGAVEGETVEITLSTEHFIKATYIMYGVPLIGFVVGMGIGIGIDYILKLNHQDICVILGALVGIIVGGLYIKLRDSRYNYDKYLPKIISKQ